MKKVLMIALAVLISVAFVTTVFAQDKKAEKPAAAAEKPAKAADKAPAAEKAAAPADKPAKAEKPAKAKSQTFKGEFVSADAAAKTIVAKNDKGDMTFDVSKIKKMAEFKAGDKIVVVYTEKDGKNWAKSVKAAKKDAPKKEKAEKPADKPAEKAADKPAAPAPAPAPKK